MAISHQITIDLATVRGVNSITLKSGSTTDELVVYFQESDSPFNVENYTLKLISDKGVYTVPKSKTGSVAIFSLNATNSAQKISDDSTVNTFVVDGWNVCNIQLVENGTLDVAKTQQFQIYSEPQISKRKFVDPSGVYITAEDIELIRKFKDTDFNLLLSVSNDDNGKFLRVVNGAWAAVNLVDVSEVGA